MELQESLPSSSHEPFGPGCSLAHCPQHVHLGIQLRRWNTLREQLDCKHESLAEILINSWYASQTVNGDDTTEHKMICDAQPRSVSDENSQPSRENEVELNRTSRRKARHMKPTKIPSIEKLVTVSLAPKRSIIGSKKNKYKPPYKDCSDTESSQQTGHSTSDSCSLKDSLNLASHDSLQPCVSLSKFDSVVLKTSVQLDYVHNDDDSVDSLLDPSDKSVNYDDGIVHSDCQGDGDKFNVNADTECADVSVESLDGEDFSESGYLAEQSLEREETFQESSMFSSPSDCDSDEDVCSKDTDSDWSPHKSNGTPRRKGQLRRSTRIKTKPATVKKEKTSDGRKSRWKRSRAAVNPRADTNIPLIEGESNSKTCDVNSKNCDLNSKTCDLNSKTCDLNSKTCDLNSKTCDLNSKTCDLNSKTCDLNNKSCDLNCKNCGLNSNNCDLNNKICEPSRPKLIKLSQNSFQCKMCSNRFSSKAEGKQHLLEHLPHKCSFCSCRFRNKPGLDAHLKVKHPITRRCNMCFYTCRTKTELRQHLLQQHHVEAASLNTTLCHICGQQFKVTINVQKHLAEVHGIVEDSLKKYVCDQCGNEYILKQSFRKHQLTHRGKIIPCSVCSKLFATHDHLRRHYNTVHLKLKKHFCPHEGCDMKFAFRRSLVSHVNMVHLKLRLFPCTWPNCDRRFYAKKHLTVHLRIHNDEKPHKCNICNYACRQRAALNWHMKKHGIFHEPLDDVTKPTYSEFPSNFKRGRKRTRFRKGKCYNMLEDQSLEKLVKSEYSSYGQDNKQSMITDMEKSCMKSVTQGSQLYLNETKMDYPTMVKPISKFQLRFGHNDEYNQEGSRDQSKSYSDDSSVDCGARNTSLPINGETSAPSAKPDQQLDSVVECPTSSFQSLQFTGHSADLHKYNDPNSYRASTSFPLFPSPHSLAPSKMNYDNVHTPLSPSNDHKLTPVHYENYEKTHAKLQEASLKYATNMNFSKYEKDYMHDDGNAGVKYCDGVEMMGVRAAGDMFHFSNDLETSQMTRVKSWINQMHMAGFQYPPSQNCFPDDIEHRLVMRKYLNDSESDLRHGMNT